MISNIENLDLIIDNIKKKLENVNKDDIQKNIQQNILIGNQYLNNYKDILKSFNQSLNNYEDILKDFINGCELIYYYLQKYNIKDIIAPGDSPSKIIIFLKIIYPETFNFINFPLSCKESFNFEIKDYLKTNLDIVIQKIKNRSKIYNTKKEILDNEYNNKKKDIKYIEGLKKKNMILTGIDGLTFFNKADEETKKKMLFYWNYDEILYKSDFNNFDNSIWSDFDNFNNSNNSIWSSDLMNPSEKYMYDIDKEYASKFEILVNDFLDSIIFFDYIAGGRTFQDIILPLFNFDETLNNYLEIKLNNSAELRIGYLAGEKFNIAFSNINAYIAALYRQLENQIKKKQENNIKKKRELLKLLKAKKQIFMNIHYYFDKSLFILIEGESFNNRCLKKKSGYNNDDDNNNKLFSFQNCKNFIFDAILYYKSRFKDYNLDNNLLDNLSSSLLNYKLKPTTIITISALLLFLYNNYNKLYLIDNKNYIISVLCLVIYEFIIPNLDIKTQITSFIISLFAIYYKYINVSSNKFNLNSGSGYASRMPEGKRSGYASRMPEGKRSNILLELQNYIINKLTKIFNELFKIPNHSLDDLKNIIKQNKDIEISNKLYTNQINTINTFNEIDNFNIHNSKYLLAFNKIKNNIPYNLSSSINNKILSIIKKIEYNKNLINQQYKQLFDYTNVLKNVKSNEICNNINLTNNIDENTINNCLDEYNKLIKNKQKNVKKIKIIFDYLLLDK